MRTHTSDFKNNIHKLGRQFEHKITYTLNGENKELKNNKLNSITLSSETELLKSVMKYIEIDSNVEIPVGTIFQYQLGLKVGNDYEYINYGNFIVKEVEVQEATRSYLIKAYDKMLYSMRDYEGFNITYPATVRDYINELCVKLGLTFANATDTFPNYDKVIQNELYLSTDGTSLGYTFRDVLDQLSEVTASNICINEWDALELRYITDTNDAINESFLKNINVKFGKIFGPVNTIVLSRAGNSDSIYDDDPVSVENNGRCEIRISENQIMNFNDRDTFIPDILQQLNGLTFSICDFDSTGVCYYEVGDKYNVSIGNETYSCLMLNNTIEITSGLSESIYVKEPDYTNLDYSKSDRTDNKINQTYILANKQEGYNELFTNQINTLTDDMKNVYKKDDVDILIQEAKNGLTNSFIRSGGTNIFRNTGLWFENGGDDSQQNPYEFWYGVVERTGEENASNLNALLLQNTTVYQSQTVPNGDYTVSFKYKKVAPLSISSVKINDITYPLNGEDETEFEQAITVTSQNIKVEFICDTDDGCEIYDLMVNVGKEKTTYTQNQNETTTDTVNISKGITITSSDKETTFKANADGTRILDNSGSVLTRFTDKGTTTKELIVENKAQVTGLLFQQIGDQVWISKI